MTDAEKLELIPDEIRNESYMDFTSKELIFVITLNLYNEYLYLKK